MVLVLMEGMGRSKRVFCSVTHDRKLSSLTMGERGLSLK